MFTVFIIGNIASGKSCASRYLERNGAYRIDLDELAKSLYQPGSALVGDLSEAFGWDILDASGGIRRDVLAERAFSSAESAELLNSIVHPVLLEQLSLRLLPVNCCSVLVPEHPWTVVEISVAAAFTDAFGLADEVVAITAPLDVRRERAVLRGMALEDFDARAALQPAEDELCSLATTVIDNSAGDDGLFRDLDAWMSAHGLLATGERAHG